MKLAVDAISRATLIDPTTCAKEAMPARGDNTKPAASAPAEAAVSVAAERARFLYRSLEAITVSTSLGLEAALLGGTGGL